jgi:hypothetical protein
MANWFHRFFNPHCQHCAELEYESACASCEVLKEEVNTLRRQNDTLLNRILEVPRIEERTVAPAPQTVLPKMVPWAVKRQMLEAEDREKARAMRNAAKPDTVEDMERAMKSVETEREAQK